MQSSPRRLSVMTDMSLVQGLLCFGCMTSTESSVVLEILGCNPQTSCNFFYSFRSCLMKNLKVLWLVSLCFFLNAGAVQFIFIFNFNGWHYQLAKRAVIPTKNKNNVSYHSLSFVAVGLVAASFHAALTSVWTCTTTAPTAKHTWVAIGGRQFLALRQTFSLHVRGFCTSEHSHCGLLLCRNPPTWLVQCQPPRRPQYEFSLQFVCVPVN